MILIEQLFVMASNAGLYVAAAVFFLRSFFGSRLNAGTKSLLFWLGVLSTGVATASNLFHYADNRNEAILAHGVNITSQEWVLFWDVNPATKMVFILLDYGFSHNAMIVFAVLLTAKTKKKSTLFFIIAGFLLYVYSMIATGSVNWTQPDQNNIRWLSVVIVAYVLLVFVLLTLNYIGIGLPWVKYYTDRFHPRLLLASVASLIVGLGCWVVIQNFWPEYYFYAHGSWHFFTGLSQVLFAFAIK